MNVIVCDGEMLKVFDPPIDQTDNMKLRMMMQNRNCKLTIQTDELSAAVQHIDGWPYDIVIEVSNHNNCRDYVKHTIDLRSLLHNTTIMQKYTVILRYPGSDETYCTSVEATGPEGAVILSRQELMENGENEGCEADDFGVIAVFRGEHNDLNPER